MGAGGQVSSIVDASVEMAEVTLGEIGSLVGFVLEWCQQGNKVIIKTHGVKNFGLLPGFMKVLNAFCIFWIRALKKVPVAWRGPNRC